MRRKAETEPLNGAPRIGRPPKPKGVLRAVDEITELRRRTNLLAKGKARIVVQLSVPADTYAVFLETAEEQGYESLPKLILECACDGLVRWRELPQFHQGAMTPGKLSRIGLFGDTLNSGRTRDMSPSQSVREARLGKLADEADLQDEQLQESLRIARTVGDLAAPLPSSPSLTQFEPEPDQTDIPELLPHEKDYIAGANFRPRWLDKETDADVPAGTA